MNPRALAVWVGAVLLVSLASGNPAFRALTLAAALAMVLLHRRPEVRVMPALLAVGGACLLAIGLTFLVNHTGVTALLVLPSWLPAIGGRLTLEAGAYGGNLALGMAACFVAGTSLSLVAEPYQLVDSLPGLLSRTAAALGAALTLVPRLGHSFLAVREAQQLRGWRARGVRSWSAVVVPSVLTAIEGSVLLAEAMEARAFGSGRRSNLTTTSWSGADLVTVLASVLGAGGFMAAVLMGLVPAWQPYPDLTVPALSGLPLGCCLLLFVPAFRR